MSKLMISQALLWATAILASAISPSDSWWLTPILATVALGNLKNALDKIPS